jgi:hypothetical protein
MKDQRVEGEYITEKRKDINHQYSKSESYCYLGQRIEFAFLDEYNAGDENSKKI